MFRAATLAECLAECTGGYVPRAQWSAGAGWRSRASHYSRAGRRPLCFTSARTERRTEQRTAVRERPLVVGGRSVSPAQERSGGPQQPRRARACAALALDRAQRCCGRRVADGATPACGNRGCRHIPTVLRGEQVHLRLSRSLTACETAQSNKGQDSGRGRNRRITAQNAIRRNGLRPYGQDAPPPPCVGGGRAATKERMDRTYLGPHKAAQEPMLARAPTPPLFTREDQVLDLR